MVFIELLFAILESMIIAFFLYFFNGGRKNKWYINIGITVLVSILLFLSVYLSTTQYSFSEYTILFDLVIIVLYFLWGLKISFLSNLFSVVFCYVTLVATNVFSIQFLRWIMEIDVNMLIEQSTIYRSFALVISKLMWLLILSLCILVKRKWGKIKLSVLEIVSLFLMGIITITSTTSVMMIIRETELVYGQYINRMILIIVGLLLLDVVIGGLLIVLVNQKRKSIESNYLKKTIDMQKEAYEVLLEGYSTHRKLSHDIKNALYAFRELIEQGDVESLKQSVEQTISDLLEDKNTRISNVNMWTAILEYKRKEAENKNIQMDCNVSTGDYSNISGTDLCIVLGNLLDNAIEAEEKEIENKQIVVRVAENFGIIYISVKNHIAKSVLKNNTNLKTTKNHKIEHGFGLRSVHEIAKKYNGSVFIDENENYFTVELMLYKH